MLKGAKRGLVNPIFHPIPSNLILSLRIRGMGVFYLNVLNFIRVV
jgi:hypothetical protein